MGSTKKRLTTPAPQAVRDALRGMSKAALVDCLADAIACVSQNESSEPEDMTVGDVADFCGPRLAIRGDRPVSVRDQEGE